MLRDQTIEFISINSKTILIELLYLGTKEVHFMFTDKVYIQNDGVTMGPHWDLHLQIYL